jgi:Zn-dependent protease with chaperone function/Tfp pilus assembly major pilin PilA
LKELVYPRERSLGAITLVIGVLIWLLLIVGTFGVALVYILMGFISYLFAQSALIAYIKGHGVELSERQFPDLHAQFVACCEKLEMDTRPQVYILSGNGIFNAFATRFLGTQFVVLYSDIVDAVAKHPDGVRFYIGHELGHLRMKHLTGRLWRWPALWLPLVGAAYARAQESTCDRHGRACSSTPENAARALAVLSAGAQRWSDLDLTTYRSQANKSSGFWMSFHELTAGYPWLTKRVARVMDPNGPMPSRHGFAYVMAFFVPYAGRLGAAAGPLILIMVIGMLAAIALPAYQEYTTRAQLNVVYAATVPARDALAKHYLSTEEIPETLEEVGIAAQLPHGAELALDTDNMSLTVSTDHGDLVLTPEVNDAQDAITWTCSASGLMNEKVLPTECRSGME